VVLILLISKYNLAYAVREWANNENDEKNP